jgi:hypothetical protein
MIVDEKGQCVGSFLPENLEKYYRFPKPKVHLVNLFVNDFYDKMMWEIFWQAGGRKIKYSFTKPMVVIISQT